jgi:signal transduction histidine kinase
MVLGGALLILLLLFAERTLRLKRSNLRLQYLARELSMVEERERRRLAGELHDSPMQKLALAQLQFSAAKSTVDPDLAARLGNGLGMMREALDELHTLQFELSPPMLYSEGIVPALDWLASRTSERSDVTFSFRTTEPALRVSEDLAILLFHCARELVYNVAKHASATTATIELGVDNADALLTVTDDGKGFDASRAPRRRGGFGLFSIRERVALFGGELSVASTEAGSKVSVRLPLHRGSETSTKTEEWSPGRPRRGDREALP